MKFGTDVHKFVLRVSVVKIDEVKTIIYLRASMNFIRTLHIYCPIWVKFGITDVDKILLIFTSCVKMGAGIAILLLRLK
jgi:hypothetical protein